MDRVDESFLKLTCLIICMWRNIFGVFILKVQNFINSQSIKNSWVQGPVEIFDTLYSDVIAFPFCG